MAASGASAGSGHFFMLEEYRDFELTELRLVDGGSVVKGHAAVFNVKSHDMGFREIILPGAFAEAVMSDDVKFLLNHEGLPLARTKSATLRLSEDQKGLAFRAQLEPADPDVQRLLPKIKRGDLNEMSFGFFIRNRETDEKWNRDSGELIRTLIKVSLADISPVTFPAYPQTDLSARAQELRAFYEKKMASAVKMDVPPLETNEFLTKIKKYDEFLARRAPIGNEYQKRINEILRRT